MEAKFYKKLSALMKSEHLSASQLSKILETQPSNISHILSGRSDPRFDLLQKILLRFPQVNPDWVFDIRDDAPMYRTDYASDANPAENSLFDAASDVASEYAKNAGQSEKGSEQPTIAPQPNEATASGRKIERIVIFYTDRTCESFGER